MRLMSRRRAEAVNRMGKVEVEIGVRGFEG
jgi:hypothetical protein